MNNILPLFYFQSTILLVDDDELLLKHLKKILGTDNNVIVTTEPNKANSIINSNQMINFETISKMISLEFTDYHHSDNTSFTLKFDFNKIEKLMNLNNRHELINVVVIDYQMPTMTGLELCRNISNKHVKKILLTAEPKDKEALVAIQNNLINSYISKGKLNTLKDLKTKIIDLQFEFFSDLTSTIVRNLELLGCYYLTDDKFINFFINLLKENDFSEYSMVNINGTFKFKNKYGKVYFFVIYDDNSLNEYFVEPYGQINGVENIINSIQSNKLIPFFGINSEPLEISIVDWNKYLYTSKELITDKGIYYWTIITNENKEM